MSWWTESDRGGFTARAEVAVKVPPPVVPEYHPGRGATLNGWKREKLPPKPADRSTVCACGRKKPSGQPKCSGCYRGTPQRSPKPEMCKTCGQQPPVHHRRDCHACVKVKQWKGGA